MELEKYWRLQVVWLDCIKKGNRQLLCRCDCGIEKIICESKLKKWLKTCWCGWAHFKYWMADTKIYKSWSCMKERCSNKNNHAYKDYWWRWITYDKRREKFEEFYKDMWESYKEWLTIDRIDNNWNYCKENCRWVTNKENNNNRRDNVFITYKWKKQTIAQWAHELWFCPWSIADRNKRWIPLDKPKRLRPWKF